MKSFPPSIGPNHPDHNALSKLEAAIYRASGGKQRLLNEFPSLLQEAVDFVVDPVITARTRISELDNVEKTFVGLKVEHYLRDFLDVPKGLRDLELDGVDVDVKNTVSSTWMIPPETFRAEEPCLLIAIADAQQQCWLGLILARNQYLGALAGNRDSKRSITAAGKANILWIAEGTPLPPSRWAGIDMQRLRELRKIKGGSKRASIFFEENLDKVIHRKVVESLLFDQKDFMKRIRGNQGARDYLSPKGIRILSGVYDKRTAIEFGHTELLRDQFIAVKVSSAPSSPQTA
jgi:Restriction endonuclease NaeI